MFKKVFWLSILALLFTASSSSAGTPPPTELSSMKSMKYKVDVLGIKLGMSSEEAMSLVEAAIPSAKFAELTDRATNQLYGWDALPYSDHCRYHNDTGCEETVRVRIEAGKIWFVSRKKNYDLIKTVGHDVPMLQVAIQSLEEKYGLLVKFGDYHRGISAGYTFNRGDNLDKNLHVIACGGGIDDGIPNSFSPDIDWYYSVDALPSDDEKFLGKLDVEMADCQYMFDIINKKAIDKAAAEQASQDAALERAAAKNLKPNL